MKKLLCFWWIFVEILMIFRCIFDEFLCVSDQFRWVSMSFRWVFDEFSMSFRWVFDEFLMSFQWVFDEFRWVLSSVRREDRALPVCRKNQLSYAASCLDNSHKFLQSVFRWKSVSFFDEKLISVFRWKVDQCFLKKVDQCFEVTVNLFLEQWSFSMKVFLDQIWSVFQDGWSVFVWQV